MAQTAVALAEVTPVVAILRAAAPTPAGEAILVEDIPVAGTLAAVEAPMVANGMRRMTKRLFR